MSYRVDVRPTGHQFTVEEGELILDAALRQGISFSYGCRGGACGACRSRVVSGEIGYGESEPMALTAEQQEGGEVLICIATAKSDLVIESEEVSAATEIVSRELQTRIVGMERLNDEVMLLNLELPEGARLQFLAGQYLNFKMSDGRTRAFSIANAPHDDRYLTFHIRLISGGTFTEQLFSDMEPGEMLTVEGPQGSFYMREESDRPMLMLATGTGFGPVKGIIEHAIAEQSARPIYLYWGARTESGLYLNDLASSWAERFNNIQYRPVLSQPSEQWQGRRGRVQQAVVADFGDLSDYELYACGHPDMVITTREELVKRGIRDENCFGDAFTWASS